MSRDDYLYDVGGEPSMPPFRFSGVGMRVFPLRASYGRLQELCDRLLGGFPDVAEIRPIDGFVELLVLDYSSITSVDQPAFATYGQTEIFFMVPVMCKERATGKRRFAVITPYIFVDSPVSARLGRDLFGWPKEAAWYRRDEVASSPSMGAATQILSMDTEMLCATGPRTSRLLEIDDQPAREYLAFGRKRTPDDPPPLDLASVLRVLSRPWLIADRCFALWRRSLLDLVTQPTTPLEMRVINLKQFPQLNPEGTAAYQALTETPLRTTRLNGFGLIGEQKQLLGDPSGGCLIRIYEDPTWPVVSKLGLKYTDATPESSEPGARLVYRLRPVLPVWSNADFDQLPSRILASRGTPAVGAAGGTTGTRVPFNSTLGSRSLLGASRGTTLSGLELQLFGLSAEATAHQQIVDELNGLDMGVSLALPPLRNGQSMVVIAIATFKGMRADRLSLPDWHGTLVELFFPVLVRGGAGETTQPALLSHASFANSNALSNAMHEVLGSNCCLAKMRRGDTSNTAQGIDNRLHVFRLSASAVRQFQLGERAEVLPVIDVFGVPRERKDSGAREPVVTLMTDGIADLPILPLLRLKQVPSAEDSRKVSYQALVKTEWRGARGRTEDVGIDHEIRLFEYDSLNLVNRLGLQHNEPDVARALQESTDDNRDQWQVYRRPFAETRLVLENDVTIASEVLWERRLR
ncbi:MAG: hypothetical protein EOO73_33380 [Myxococcales bacterium]|nr:MAG: hypothetical protein EOO73_33380 [Myxococcales bacterium]